MPDPLTELLAAKRVVLIDGATGTHIKDLAKVDRIDLPVTHELLNLQHPDLVRRHYRGYLRAGSDVVLTNSWAANRYALEEALEDAAEETGEVVQPTPDADEVRAINRAAAALLSEAISASGRTAVRAGSVGPTGWIVEAMDDEGPFHDHELAYGDAVSAFVDQIVGLVDGGVDLIWIETQISPREVQAAIDACKIVGERTNRKLPYVVSMVFNRSERTQAEYDVQHFAKDFGLGADRPVALGLNCGYGPDVVLELIAANRDSWSGTPPLLVKANCGPPRRVGHNFEPSGLTPRQMGRYAQLAADYGARLIGACCGSLPEHVEAMRSALHGYTPSDPPSPTKIKDEIEKGDWR